MIRIFAAILLALAALLPLAALSGQAQQLAGTVYQIDGPAPVFATACGQSNVPASTGLAVCVGDRAAFAPDAAARVAIRRSTSGTTYLDRLAPVVRDVRRSWTLASWVATATQSGIDLVADPRLTDQRSSKGPADGAQLIGRPKAQIFYVRQSADALLLPFALSYPADLSVVRDGQTLFTETIAAGRRTLAIPGALVAVGVVQLKSVEKFPNGQTRTSLFTVHVVSADTQPDFPTATETPAPPDQKRLGEALALAEGGDCGGDPFACARWRLESFQIFHRLQVSRDPLVRVAASRTIDSTR